MIDQFKEWHGDTILGAALFGFVIWSVWSGWRFRKRALRLAGEVIKVIRYSKHISYYIGYRHADTTKVAEYCGPGLIATYKEGDTLEILVEPGELPNVKVPEGTHVRWSRAGNCVPADGGIVSALEVICVVLGLFLLVRGL